MRLVKRRIRQLFTILSILLFCAFAILWIRSYYRVDAIGGSRKNSRWHIGLSSMKGAVSVNFTTLNRPFAESSFHYYGGDPSRSISFPGMHQLGPFAYTDQTTTYLPSSGLIRRDRVVEFPHWIILIATAILPAFGMRRGFRDRAKLLASSHACSKCGYDLRATPTRCPECGHQPSQN
jgi:hypothetical protein